MNILEWKRDHEKHVQLAIIAGAYENNEIGLSDNDVKNILSDCKVLNFEFLKVLKVFEDYFENGRISNDEKNILENSEIKGLISDNSLECMVAEFRQRDNTIIDVIFEQAFKSTIIRAENLFLHFGSIEKYRENLDMLFSVIISNGENCTFLIEKLKVLSIEFLELRKLVFMETIEPSIKSEWAGGDMTAVQKISNEISFFLSKINNFPDEEAFFINTIDDDWQKDLNFLFRENIWELTDKCFLELEHEEFESFINRILKSLDNAKFTLKDVCLCWEDLKNRYPNENFEIIEKQILTLQTTKTALKLFFSSKLEEYKTDTKKLKPNQLQTKLTDTQRGKLFDLLVSGEFIPATSDREGFVWAFGGVNDKYTSFKTEWLKAKNLAVYLIDKLCFDESLKIQENYLSKAAKMFGLKSPSQIKNGYRNNNIGVPYNYKLIDEIITEAQK